MTGPREHAHMLPAEGVVDRDSSIDELLTERTRELPAVPSRAAVQAGIRVAHAHAGADPYDPARPTLAQLVTDEVAQVERRQIGRREVDRDNATLRARVAEVIAQRESLAAARVKVAQQRIAEGNYGAAASELTWAASLTDQAAALRMMLR